jgi:hypothetical protein
MPHRRRHRAAAGLRTEKRVDRKSRRDAGDAQMMIRICERSRSPSVANGNFCLAIRGPVIAKPPDRPPASGLGPLRLVVTGSSSTSSTGTGIAGFAGASSQLPAQTMTQLRR